MTRQALFLAVAGLLLASVEARADHGKVDRVVLANGNTLTCEVVALQRGKLSAKVDGMGTVSIEWEHVRRVTSAFVYEVELTSGRFLLGSIASPADNRLVISTLEGDETADVGDVVRIVQIEAGLWKRLEGSVDLGFSFAQADSLTQWSFNSTVSRRTPKYLNQVTLSSQETIDSTDSRQSRNSLGYTVQRFLGNRWFFSPGLQLTQNEQLGLIIRSVLAAAVGRYLVQSNRTLLGVLGGVTYTVEHFSGEDATNRSEAVGAVRWDWFTFGDRESDISVVVAVYENLGSGSRTRVEATTNFRRKFFKDFYWSFNVVESYDSSPPDAQKKNDSSIALALGWSF